MRHKAELVKYKILKMEEALRNEVRAIMKKYEHVSYGKDIARIISEMAKLEVSFSFGTRDKLYFPSILFLLSYCATGK